MFKHVAIVFASILFSPGMAAVVSAQSAGFEGVVVYKTTMGAEGGEMTQMYKTGKARTEITTSKGQSSIMIMDVATGAMTMLIPQQKMYMVMDLRKMGEGLKGVLPPSDKQQKGPAAGPAKAPSIKATGVTESVAGYTCEWYIMGERDENEVCSAKGLGFFLFGQSPMGRGAASMSALAGLGSNSDLAKLFRDGFFPLKVAQNKGGKKQVMMEATKIEKKSLDASLFVPPPDYHEMKMPFGR